MTYPNRAKEYIMKKISHSIIILISFYYAYICFGSNQERLSDYYPVQEWRIATPESQGLDSEQLVRAFDYIQEEDLNIHSIMVIRNGYQVLNAHFYPYKAGNVHNQASVTKSIVSVLIGILIDQGKINNVDQSVLDFFPEYQGESMISGKEDLTIEHLLTMRSGLNRGRQGDEDDLQYVLSQDDWVKAILAIPLVHRPGSQWNYYNLNVHLLTALITKITGMTPLDFAQQHLFNPLGFGKVLWPADPQKINYGWSDLCITPRDMAKIGYLYLKDGLWEGRQLISAEWVRRSIRDQITLEDEEAYGYLWWTSDPNSGWYQAVGRGGQKICVWPHKQMVMVFTGGGFNPDEMVNFIRTVLKSDSSLPENTEAHQLLSEKIRAAAGPPEPDIVPSLPKIAEKISEKTIKLEDNMFQLQSLKLTFTHKSEAFVDLQYGFGHSEHRALGLDNVYRISPGGRVFGLPVALKGGWKTDKEFVFFYNEVANINCFKINLLFNGQNVDVSINEATGSVKSRFKGSITG